IESADDAANVLVQHALVVDVGAKANGSGIPGDPAGVFDRHRGVGADVDAAARLAGGVAGQAAAADGRRDSETAAGGIASVDAAALLSGEVAGHAAAVERQRTAKD